MAERTPQEIQHAINEAEAVAKELRDFALILEEQLTRNPTGLAVLELTPMALKSMIAASRAGMRYAEEKGKLLRLTQDPTPLLQAVDAPDTPFLQPDVTPEPVPTTPVTVVEESFLDSPQATFGGAVQGGPVRRS